MRALNRHGNPKESHGLNQSTLELLANRLILNTAGWLLGWIEQQVPGYAGRSIPAVVPFGPVPINRLTSDTKKALWRWILDARMLAEVVSKGGRVCIPPISVSKTNPSNRKSKDYYRNGNFDSAPTS